MKAERNPFKEIRDIEPRGVTADGGKREGVALTESRTGFAEDAGRAWRTSGQRSVRKNLTYRDSAGRANETRSHVPLMFPEEHCERESRTQPALGEAGRPPAQTSPGCLSENVSLRPHLRARGFEIST